VNGRHTETDRLSVVLGGAWAATGAAPLTLLAIAARDPCPCSLGGLRPVQVSAPDHPPPEPE